MTFPSHGSHPQIRNTLVKNVTSQIMRTSLRLKFLAALRTPLKNARGSLSSICDLLLSFYPVNVFYEPWRGTAGDDDGFLCRLPQKLERHYN